MPFTIVYIPVLIKQSEEKRKTNPININHFIPELLAEKKQLYELMVDKNAHDDEKYKWAKIQNDSVSLMCLKDNDHGDVPEDIHILKALFWLLAASKIENKQGNVFFMHFIIDGEQKTYFSILKDFE